MRVRLQRRVEGRMGHSGTRSMRSRRPVPLGTIVARCGLPLMSSSRRPPQLDVRDRAKLHADARNGIAMQLRKEMKPEGHLLQRLLDLVSVLEKAERK